MTYRNLNDDEVRLPDQNLDQLEPTDIAGAQREEGLDKRESPENPRQDNLEDLDRVEGDEIEEEEYDDDEPEFEEGLLGEDDDD